MFQGDTVLRDQLEKKRELAEGRLEMWRASSMLEDEDDGIMERIFNSMTGKERVPVPACRLYSIIACTLRISLTARVMMVYYNYRDTQSCLTKRTAPFMSHIALLWHQKWAMYIS